MMNALQVYVVLRHNQPKYKGLVSVVTVVLSVLVSLVKVSPSPDNLYSIVAVPVPVQYQHAALSRKVFVY